jgi:hypothetical protein
VDVPKASAWPAGVLVEIRRLVVRMATTTDALNMGRAPRPTRQFSERQVSI